MSHKATTLLHDLRALPGAFWVLFAGMGINRFGTFIYPFLTIVLHARGVPLGHIGVILSGFGIGMLGATLAGGWFSDRFGRRNTIAFGTFTQAALMFALYFPSSSVILTILTTLAGFAGGFYHPASSALVADLVPMENRLTAYALLRLAGNAGFALGAAAGGFLVHFHPFWLFAGDGLTTLAFGLLAITALPHGLRHARKDTRWSEAIAVLRKDAAFWALACAQMSVAFVFAQFATSYAVEVTQRQIALSLGAWRLGAEQIYGLLIGLNGVLIMALKLPITRWTGILNPRRVMAAGYVLIGIGFASNIIDSGFGLLSTGMVLFTLGEMMVMPMVGVWISRIAPERMRGRYMGMLLGAWALGNLLGQNVGLQLIGVHPNLLWGICAGFGLISAAVITLLGRQSHEPVGTIAASAVAAK